MEEDEARLVDAEVDHDEKAQGHPAPRMHIIHNDLIYGADTSCVYVSPHSLGYATRNDTRIRSPFRTVQKVSAPAR